MLIPMTKEHVNSVANIHLLSWAHYEISVKLGFRYLKTFYKYIAYDPNSFGYVFIHDNDILAYAVGFNNYLSFNRNFQENHFVFLIRLALLSFLKTKLKISDILNILIDNKKLNLLEHPEYHLGALAVQTEYMGTQIGRTAVLESIRAVINHLQHAGYPSCWGCCDERNISMQKTLVNRFGFTNKGIHRQKDRNTVMFEKYFTTVDELSLIHI